MTIESFMLVRRGEEKRGEAKRGEARQGEVESHKQKSCHTPTNRHNTTQHNTQHKRQNGQYITHNRRWITIDQLDRRDAEIHTFSYTERDY
mmetsp:Transcript_28107/g.30290  ORF Transcript_28107/g.30290 Transcript_28107/m.30290 type:complete len:91 (-) Transcript_28107:10-282(-)